jgi:phosphoglycolate phosphatase-like HAD superfamily hydrolase
VLRALELFGAPARAAVMIGDTAADVLAAQAAGTLSGAALWGTQDREVLLALDPTYTFDHPNQILQLTEHPPDA